MRFATFLAALSAFTVLVPAQDPLVKQALQRIEKVEQAEAKANAGELRTLQGLLGDLDWAQKRLNAVVRPDQAHTDANRRLQEVRTKVVAKQTAPAPQEAPPATPAPTPTPVPAAPATVSFDAEALQQLRKDVAAATYNFDIVPANLWTDAGRRRALERDLQALTERLAKFPAAAEVQAVREGLAALQQKFVTATGKVAGDANTGPALAQRVEALLTNKYQPANLPTLPTQPLEPDAVRQFLLAMQQWRQVDLPADRAFAEQAMQNTAIDRQRAETLRHTVTQDWPQRLAERQQQLAAAVQGAVADAVRHASWLLATDVRDQDQITNRVLGRGAFDAQMVMLRREAAAIQSAQVHDELADPALPRPTAKERQAQAEQVEQAIRHLQALAVAMLDTVRVPPAASTDPELLRIAEQTLRQPDHGVGAWQRLVINAPKVRRERHEASLQQGAVRDTITVYHYVWDEFQVTTVETVGASTWLYYNTLKFFHSGDATTPIGRWILSQRFESTQILPHNVAK